jgi:eukaryotic-like serine/threonine-protein kinase
LYQTLGHADEARKEWNDLESVEPRTSWDYLIRGTTFLNKKEYTKALIDYRTSATLNPRNVSAWNNQAHVLGEKLKETDSAIAAMERACNINPQMGELQLGLGVLYARAGQREKAHHAAQKGLLLTENASQIYQAACVYSLTSATHTEDAEQAVSFLRKSIAAGFRKNSILQNDHDIDAIRGRSDVQKILDAAIAIVD